MTFHQKAAHAVRYDVIADKVLTAYSDVVWTGAQNLNYTIGFDLHTGEVVFRLSEWVSCSNPSHQYQPLGYPFRLQILAGTKGEIFDEEVKNGELRLSFEEWEELLEKGITAFRLYPPTEGDPGGDLLRETLNE